MHAVDCVEPDVDQKYPNIITHYFDHRLQITDYRRFLGEKLTEVLGENAHQDDHNSGANDIEDNCQSCEPFGQPDQLKINLKFYLLKSFYVSFMVLDNCEPVSYQPFCICLILPLNVV